MNEVIKAAELLEATFGIASNIFSATSYSALSRDAEETERQNRLSQQKQPLQSHVQQTLGTEIPVIAASDYVRAVPQMIAQYLRKDSLLWVQTVLGEATSWKTYAHFLR